MKALALSLALACALVGCRTNETPREQVNDLEITASIKSKLASDVGLSTIPDVSVNSTNGVVTLSGSVDSAATKSKVEDVARNVPKVVRVVDNLQVGPAPPGR
jgi:hyperosmotically inducible protein